MPEGKNRDTISQDSDQICQPCLHQKPDLTILRTNVHEYRVQNKICFDLLNSRSVSHSLTDAESQFAQGWRKLMCRRLLRALNSVSLLEKVRVSVRHNC